MATPLVLARAARPSGHPFPRGVQVDTLQIELENVIWDVAKKRPTVRCPSPDEWRKMGARWAAQTRGGLAPTVTLSPAICANAWWLSTHFESPVWGDRSREELAFTVGVIGHEAVHVWGTADEATAECYGMQWIPEVAEFLNRTKREGRYLADLYWKKIYTQEKPPYRSPRCRNGGPMDGRRTTNDWP